MLAHFLNNAILVLLGMAGLDRRLDASGHRREVGAAGRASPWCWSAARRLRAATCERLSGRQRLKPSALMYWLADNSPLSPQGAFCYTECACLRPKRSGSSASCRKSHRPGRGARGALNKLMAGAQLGTYRARQVVYLPGDRASGIHFVGNGRVKISKVTRDGKELTLAYRATGDFFGETCLLDGGPREEMVEAMEPCTTVEVAAGPARPAAAARNVAVAYQFARTLIAPPPRPRDQGRAADLQGRRLEAGRAAPAPRLRARRREQEGPRPGPEDHPPGDGQPHRLHARDGLADAVAVQAQGLHRHRGRRKSSSPTPKACAPSLATGSVGRC